MDFLLDASHVIFLGPSGTRKSDLSIAPVIQTARRSDRAVAAHQRV